MDVTLDQDEALLLREVLDGTLRDLRYEIADTDNMSYRRGLRERQEHLKALLEKLGGPVPEG